MHMVSQTTRDLKLRIFGTLVQWLECSLFSAFNMPPTSFTVKATRQTDRQRQTDRPNHPNPTAAQYQGSERKSKPCPSKRPSNPHSRRPDKNTEFRCHLPPNTRSCSTLNPKPRVPKNGQGAVLSSSDGLALACRSEVYCCCVVGSGLGL